MVSALSAASAATQTSASKASANLNTNYETFLSLLTAQVKNQDPLSPMDTTEWTNQLVQYSSVEQAIKSNDYLEKIAQGSGDSLANAANYVGKSVEAEQAIATLKDGKASWSYDLGSEAKAVTLSLTNASGVVVYASEGTGKTAGSHNFEWNGKSANGQALPDGQYTLSVTATSNTNSVVDAKVLLKGAVQAVQTGASGLELLVNNTPVALNAVKRIY